jgi:hypothetical protein
VNEQSIAQMLNEAFPPAVRSALNPADLASLAERVREELELRVGERLSAGLTDAQMNEFERLTDDPDTPESAFAEWFRTHRPNYRETVKQTLEELIQETACKVTAALTRQAS